MEVNTSPLAAYVAMDAAKKSIFFISLPLLTFHSPPFFSLLLFLFITFVFFFENELVRARSHTSHIGAGASATLPAIQSTATSASLQ